MKQIFKKSKTKKMKKLLTAMVVFVTFSSCNNYYKAITTAGPATAVNIEDLKIKDKYFILRDGNGAFTMNNISFTADQKMMQCTLDSLPDIHKLHLKKGRYGKMRYENSNGGEQDESVVLKEVHVYVSPDTNTVTGPYTVSLNNLQKIEVLKKDKQKTNKSTALAIGITVTAIALLVGGIAALIPALAFSAL